MLRIVSDVISLSMVRVVARVCTYGTLSHIRWVGRCVSPQKQHATNFPKLSKIATSYYLDSAKQRYNANCHLSKRHGGANECT